MIWIRADANSKIGTGHVMRCLSIAAALKKCGQEVCFLLADNSAAELLQSRGQKYRILDSDYRSMETELPRLCQWLRETPVSCLLIDSYFVTDAYLRQVRGFTKTAYVDDVNKFPYPVDLLMNYNIYANDINYEATAAVEGMQFLLGTAYVPLREEFKNVEYTVRDELQDVLITTGGSDAYFLAGQILEKVLSDDRTAGLHYHVVSGAFNQNLPALQEMEKRHSNVHVYRNVTEMSELMRNCDAAITAGGSTMYELCAVGVPIICFSFVDNQEQIVRTFVRDDIVCFGGDYLVEQERLFDGIAEQLAALGWDRRMKYSKRERELVDGCGAVRISQALCSLENR